MWKDAEIDINSIIPKEILQKLESYKGIKFNNFVFNCSYKFSYELSALKVLL